MFLFNSRLTQVKNIKVTIDDKMYFLIDEASSDKVIYIGGGCIDHIARPFVGSDGKWYAVLTHWGNSTPLTNGTYELKLLYLYV
jgi:hypothetical protein